MKMIKYFAPLLALLWQLNAQATDDTFTITGSDNVTLNASVIETFDNPWAMAFLPDGRALVSEKGGVLWLLDKQGKKLEAVKNAPETAARGQGGLGDIVLHPNFSANSLVFISYVERDPKDDSLSGAVVERAKLAVGYQGGELRERQIIWRQAPKMTGNGHYGHKLAFSPQGYLFITSGDRQKFTPAQNMETNIGKVLRINSDGSVPSDNPFFSSGGVTSQIWSLGHRNPLGIAFDAEGKLWVHEMGPRNGDELNHIERARNYGYPNVSQGEHYSGVKIPSHEDIPIYAAPAAYWVPAISPAGFMIYQADYFENFKGNGFLGGLSSQALVRVSLGQASMRNKYPATEEARYTWGKRVREVEQGPQGEIFVLEDGDGGRLLKLSK